ncbi:MAG TPA: DNA polymerase, partial [Maribacter sp.]|nr:DNA polymerase [Maribacter sp.]
GNTRHVHGCIQHMYPDSIQADTNLINVVTIDIETAIGDGFPTPAEARQEILAITLKSSKNNKYTVFGMKHYDPSLSELDVEIEYFRFDNEHTMLSAFVEWWEQPQHLPDVITGWNTRFFDIPYIVNRLARVLGEDQTRRLS